MGDLGRCSLLLFGNISPSGAGPASAVSIMMALVAGVLAMIYALVQRKAD